MARPPGSAIVDPKTGQITPEWLDFLSRDFTGESGGITIIKPGPGGSSNGGGGSFGPVDANTLTGSTLAPNVIFSSLTSVGILTAGMLGPGFLVDFSLISTRGQIPWTALPSGTGTWSVGHVGITGVVTAQAFVGDGSGLTNLPLAAHALTHYAGGTDPIKLDALAVPDDLPTLNATTAVHGLLPKLSGVSTQYLNGQGQWTEPGSTGGGALAPHASTHMPGGADVLTLSATARVLGRVSAGAGPIELLSYIDLPTTIPGPPVANVGRLHCLDVNGYELFVAQDVTGADLFLSRDTVTVVKVVGQPIARGQVVYISGAGGANAEVQLARADVAGTLPAIGFALDAGAVNAFIRVMTAGKIAQIDTSLFTEGDRLFVSTTNAGGLTVTPPPYPNYMQRVGVVTRAHATQGEVLVFVSTAVRDQHAPSHETGGSDPITALAATVLTTGTLNDARLSPNVLTVPGGYPGSTGVFLRGDGTWAVTSGGAGGGPHHTTHETGGSDPITQLDASVITTGTVNDARLSANVALRNSDNVFTAVNQVNNTGWRFTETALAPDTRLWKIGPSGGTFYFSPLLETGGGLGSYVSITRDGILEASKHLRAAQDVYALNGAFYGSGIGLTNLPAQNLIQGPLPYSVVTLSAASRVLGRGDSGPGAMQEIMIGFGLTMTGTTLSATGSGGSGGPHHTTHEPGGSDQLVGAAWLAQANIFIPVQRFNAGVRIVNNLAPADARVWSLENTSTGAFKIHPLTDVFADKPTIYVSFSPTGDLIVSQDLYAVTVNLSGRVQWGTTVSDPMLTRVGTGLEARLGDNSALTTLRAKLDASDVVSGTLSDARLSLNVLKYPGGYPGGTTLYLRADGTWVAPPGSGVQGDEVFIGPGDPGAAYELWYDTDEPIAGVGVGIHATTHSAGGTDPVTVTALAGFPGGVTTYLRADGTWAAPGGVIDALYWVSTAHSGLTAEVSLGALASGYLKITTTAGSATPSSVAAIPQSDVTNLVSDLALKAPLASPALTGVPTAPTATAGTSTTQLATTAFVTAAVGAVTGVPPALHATTHKAGGSDAIALDTLAAPSDITTLNASTTAHGLLPKLSGNATQFLSGAGTWGTVSGDEVFIGTADPGATYELWYDTDEPAIDPTVLLHHLTHEAGGADEIVNINAARLTSGTLADARLSTNVPLKNASNIFTKTYAVGAPAISIQAALPLLSLIETAAPVDQRQWRIFASQQVLYLAASNDAETVNTVSITLDRAGNVTTPRVVNLKGSTPFLALTDMTQPADQRAFILQNASGALVFTVYNDAFTVPGPQPFLMDRAGNTRVCPVQTGNRLQFGGGTSAFPALRWTGANLECVLADNSNWAGFRCATLDCYSTATIAAGLNANGGISCANSITLKDGANPYVTLTQSGSYLRFNSSNYGQITYVDMGGNWTLMGGLIPVGGVQFVSTGASADVTVLDYYKETLWTPYFGFSSGGAPTYGLQHGLAVKIGRFVYFGGRISIQTRGSMGAGGNVALHGLPWVSEGTYWGGGLYAGYVVGTAVAAGIAGYVPPASQYVQLTAPTTGGIALLNPDWMNAGFDMIFFGSYYAST